MLKRKMTPFDLEDKGLPFECDNCGNKPTAKAVIDGKATCDICGDTILASTVDTADLLQDLTEIVQQLAQYGNALWDEENFRVGVKNVDSGLINDARNVLRKHGVQFEED